MSDEIAKGSHLSKVTVHGTVYFFSSVLTKGASAFLLPIYTRHLSPAEYGVYANVMAIAGVLGIFVSLYMDSSFVRTYFDHYSDHARLRALFSSVFWFMAVWGGLFLAASFPFIVRFESDLLKTPVYPYAVLTVVIPLLLQLRTLGAAFFRQVHQSFLVALSEIFAFAVQVGLTLYLLLRLDFSSDALLWGVLGGHLSANLLLYCMLAFKNRLLTLTFRWGVMKETLVLGLSLLPLAGCSWILQLSDRLLITHFNTTASAGIYSVAYDISQIISMVYISIFWVYGPIMMVLLKNERDKAMERINEFQSFYLHLLLGLSLFASMFAREGVMLLTEKNYHEGYYLVPIIVFAFFFQGMRKLYATIVYYHKKNLLISLGGVGQAVINLGLNLALIPRFGREAAAWSTFAAMLAGSVYYYILAVRLERLQFQWNFIRASLGITAACSILWGFDHFLLKLDFWPSVLYKILLLGVFIGLSGISPYGRNLAKVLKTMKSSTG